MQSYSCTFLWIVARKLAPKVNYWTILLRVGSENVHVFCVLEECALYQCGGGSWTLAVKINGEEVIIISAKIRLIFSE